jgi:hypothetical protein
MHRAVTQWAISSASWGQDLKVCPLREMRVQWWPLTCVRRPEAIHLRLEDPVRVVEGRLDSEQAHRDKRGHLGLNGMITGGSRLPRDYGRLCSASHAIPASA